MLTSQAKAPRPEDVLRRCHWPRPCRRLISVDLPSPALPPFTSSMSSLDSDTVNEVVLAVADKLPEKLKASPEMKIEMQKRKLESLEFQSELIADEREEQEEAKQEILSLSLASKAASTVKDEANAQAAAAAAAGPAAVDGYVRGAAGTGDEATFAAATATTATPSAPAKPAAGASTDKPAKAFAVVAGATASAAGEALASAPVAVPLLPDLTLSEIEAIADLARCPFPLLLTYH